MSKSSGERNLEEVGKRWESEFPGTDGRVVQLFASINTLRRFSEEHYQAALRPLGLTYSDFRVLATLLLFVEDGEEGLSPTTLLTTQALSSGGMTRLLDRLESLKLTKRSSSREDRRSVVVSLTAKGRRETRRACAAVWKSYSVVLGDEGPAAIGKHVSALQAVIGFLEEAQDS